MTWQGGGEVLVPCIVEWFLKQGKPGRAFKGASILWAYLGFFGGGNTFQKKFLRKLLQCIILAYAILRTFWNIFKEFLGKLRKTHYCSIFFKIFKQLCYFFQRLDEKHNLLEIF